MKRDIYNSTRIDFLKKATLTIILISGLFSFINAQVIEPFTQRTSQYTPGKVIYNVKGDFALIGNTNLTLVNYGDNTSNNNSMQYVDVDGISSTLNSLSSTLSLSTENGAIPECSNIVYAGLYWTGRSHNGGNSPMTFSVTKGGVTVNFDKQKVLLKGPGAGTYTTVTANASDIYFPTTNHGQMYSAYAEVTDYVRQYGVGSYMVANVALNEGNGGGTGYYGGWGMIVIYENSKMNWRDVTVFDGHAYVAGGVTANYTIPVSGFNTVQSGNVNLKLGVLAGEGDRNITGDYLQIRNHTNTNWINLNHTDNSTNNFFNSSIFTGGNTRNPNLINNTGLDISMFDIPNAGNSVITNNQTSTSFRYGSTQDTYTIFMMAMSVDAYIPTPEAQNSVISIDGVPYISGNPLNAQPGDEIEITVEVRNKGTEAIDDAELVIPIPFASTYFSSSRQIFFAPLPTPNNLYFDPTLGANGSIVWEIGTLPLPADPNDLLGTLTFKIKVTEDCTILSNVNCDAEVVVHGHMNGIGQISGTVFQNHSTMQGYQMSGICAGEPILSPFTFSIDEAAFVTANCAATPTVLEFLQCNVGSTIAITEVSGHFPAGSRYYNQYPVTGSATEYTISNPFPATPGVRTYYAVPPGSTSCYFEFTIEVLDLTSFPTSTSSVLYCHNDIAVPLTATASNPAYTLYYYSTLAGIPQLSITPSTSTVGTFTYYVSEGLSGSCISTNKLPIQVIVNPLPVAPTSAASNLSSVCFNDAGNIVLTATGGSGDILNWYTGSCNGTLIGTGNNLSIASPSATTTYYAAWENSCGISACSQVTVIVNPAITVGLAVSAELTSYNSSTGEITVTAGGGTPPFTYSLNGGAPQASNIFSNLASGTYNITVYDSEGCSETAQITINNALQIIAVDDAGTVNGMTGGTPVVNVLVNDLLNGAPVDLTDVNLTFISSTHSNISLVGVDVVVAPGTPAGTYYLVYEICEIANPTNCDQATVTITVEEAVIDAIDDYAGGINGTSGQIDVLNVFDNDLLNGNPVDPADVILTEVTPDPTGTLTLNPDGSVDVAPFTLGGTYTLTYQICEVLNPTNCDQAVVTIEVIKTSDVSIIKTQIDPSNLPVGNPTQLIEIFPSVITAGTQIYYFLMVENFGPDNSMQATIQDIVPAGITNPQYSLNFGNSWFAWGGTRYLAEFLYPGVNYVMIRGDVDPTATGTLVNTGTIYSAVTNDPDLSNNESTVTTTILSSADLGLTKRALTSPVVIGGPIVYEIVVTNYGPSEATDVIITDIVDPAIISSVEYSVNGGGAWLSPWTGSLNIGDLSDGSVFTLLIRGTVVDASPFPNVDPIPNTASVTSSDPDPDPTNDEETIYTPLNEEADVSIVKSGPATVVAGTQIQYSIIVTNNSNTFDAGNVEILDVINSAIIANAEYSVDGGASWLTWTGHYTVGNMLPLSSFILEVRGTVVSSHTGTVVNTATVSTDTPDSDVTNNTSTVITIVEIVSDLNIVKIQVDPSILPLTEAQIMGNPNDITINPVEITAGEDIYYVLFYWNEGSSDATNVIIDDILPGFVIDWEASRCQANYGAWAGTGNLGTIIAGGRCVLVIRGSVMPSATGNLVNTAYIHSDDVTDPDPTNDESTFVTPIQAMSDLSIAKTVNNSTPYVGDNVTFTITLTNNGPSEATNVEVTDQLPSGYTYVSHTVSSGNYNSGTGIWDVGTVTFPGSEILTITASVNIPGGNYLNVVTITDLDQFDPESDNDEDEESTNPVNVIIANDDNAGPINGYEGAVNILNVFGNDLLNGSPVIPADLTLTETVADPTGNLTLNADGSIDLAPGTPEGTYTLTYQICEIANPTNCDDAIVTITVDATPIIANDDIAGGANGYDGVIAILNVFDNDLLNGDPVVPAEVILTETVPEPNGYLTLNPDGTVDLAPGTPAGTYTLTYQICEVLNPTNCDDALVIITVAATSIIANDDTATDIDGTAGVVAVLNVFDNDLLNGNPVNPAEVTLTETVADPNGYLTLNPDGTVDVEPGTPAGTYTLTYEICEILNPTNCDDAIVTITVVPGEIIANDDIDTDVNGYTGEIGILNVFDNDLLSGDPVNPADVILTETVPEPNGYLTLNPDGTVDLAPGTPEGTYTLTYQICEILNPTNCDDALVIITVGAASIIANDDYAFNVNGHTGENAVVVVFDNDLLNGNPVNPTEVTLTETIPEDNGYLVLNPDGTVDVMPGTPAGTYYLTYQICEILNPANCDDAQVFVTVLASAIGAFDDDFTSTPVDCELGGIAGNVLTNDLLDGLAVISTDVIITITNDGGIVGVTISPNGDLNIPAGLAVGNYNLSYQICEVINPANCDEADIVITVLDSEDPTITCPADVYVNSDAGTCEATNVVIGTPTVNDNCGVNTVTGVRDDMLALTDPYPLGTTTITWTVTDFSGNFETCDQLVVVTDIELPTITCPVDVAVNTDADECTASGVVLGTPTVDDNCTVTTVTNDAPAIFPIGNTTVTWTVTDGSGNIATCEQIVTVTDIELPTITCPTDVAVNTDADECTASGVVLGTPTVDDNCTVTTVTNDAPAIFPIGNTTVTWTVTDGSGNIATCEQIVTVTDIELPTITCPTDVAVNTDANECTASGVVLGTPTVDDNCTVASVTNDAPAIFPIGNTTVTWTVTDGSGNIATCEQIVTVTDIELPTITCPTDVAVNTDADECTASGVVLGTPTVDDNCTVATVTNDAPAIFPIGNTTVTWTVTDGSGNIATCEQIVTLTDIELPTITCPTDVAVNTDADECTASGVVLGTPTVDDNCTVASVTNDAPAIFPIGNTTVTWTVTDGSGNIATCEQIVTVTDIELPTITCPVDVAVNTDADECTASGVVLGTPTVDDNCTVASVTNDAPAIFPIGNTTVTWTVTDGSGNIATCEQIVTVTDIELPTITCPVDVAVNTDADECTASGVVLGTPTVDDNCTVTTVTNDAPAIFPIGNTTVTWTVTDGSGNIATCEQIVTLTDIELPTITCPTDVAVNTDADECTASGVVLGTPTVDDNCTVASVTNDAPAIFPIGNTTVTWTVTDGSGNIATCEQIVTVTDIELPTITCPTDVAVNTDADECTASGVVLGTPTVDDNCTVATVTNNAPAVFPIGNTTVTWTVTDGSGNIATCEQIVTVTDIELPTITCPIDVAVNTDADECTASGVVLGTPTVDDNCTVATVTNDAPAIFPIGNTTVTWTVTDGSGNIATCEQIVTVTDIELPTITCPTDVAVNTDANECTASGVVLGTPTVDDNCTIASVTNDAPAIFPIGNTTVTWTVTDGSGNIATCQQIVTVTDIELPTITCPVDVAVNTDADECTASGVVLGTPTVDDNCTVASVTNDAPAVFPIGNTTVTWTVTDGSGNIATCEQIVTVTDIELPTITCPTDVAVNTDADECTASGVVLGTPTVDDNCTVATVTNDAPAVFPIGNTTVTWTVTDGSGNIATCEQIVTVTDNQMPTVVCPADIISCSNMIELGMPVVSDNCGIASVTNNAPEMFPSGITVVTWEVVDINGNISYCDQTVNVSLMNITVSVSNEVSCYNGTNGAITVEVDGASGNLSYILNGGNPQSSNVFTDLTSGYYSVVVSDESGCSVTSETVFIANPYQLTAEATVNSNVTCFGDENGLIEIIAAGGTGELLYSINASMPQTSPIFTDLAAGYYTIVVTDENGCSVTINATVTSPEEIVLSYTPHCNTGIVGVDLSATGGNEPYQFSIDGGTSYFDLGNFENLVNGTDIYLMVTDANGCSSEIDVVSVESLNTLEAAVNIINNNNCYGINDAVVEIVTTGGVAPYVFTVNGTDIHYDNLIQNLATGENIITIRDSNGCPAETQAVITAAEPILFELISKTNADCNGNDDGTAEIEVMGGSAPYIYEWSNGSNQNVVADLGEGTHTLTVTDLKGCEQTYEIKIDSDQISEVPEVNNVFTPNNDGQNDYFVIDNLELYPENELVVMNRWGNEVYTQSSYKNLWNGSNLSEGTYFYILKVKMCDEVKTIDGYITILR